MTLWRSIRLASALAIASACTVAPAQRADPPAPTQVRPPTAAETAQIERLWQSLSYFRAHGGYASALESLPKLFALLEPTYGPRHPMTLSVRSIQAESLAATRRHAEAEQLYAQLLPSFTQTAGVQEDARDGFTIARAANLVSWGRPAPAEALLSPLVKKLTSQPDGRTDQFASIAANLANLREVQGRYGEGETFARRALAIRETTLKADAPLILSSRAMVARLLIAQGRYDEAGKILGPPDATTPPDSVGAARLAQARAMLLTAQSRFIDAEAWFLKAGQAFVAQAGYTSPEALVASAQWRLAVLRLHELPADWLSRTKLPLIPGIDCRTAPTTLAEVWELRAEAAGRSPDDASVCHRLVLAFDREHLGATNPATTQAMEDLAASLNELGNTDEAEELARAALAQRAASLGADHPDTRRALGLLGNVLAAQGRFDEASVLAAQLVAGTKGVELGPLADQAALLDQQGRFAEATPIWNQAVQRLNTAPQDLRGAIRVIGGYVFNQQRQGKCSADWYAPIAALVVRKRQANPMAAMLNHDDPLEEAYAQTLACQDKWSEAAAAYGRMANAQLGKVAPAFGWYRPAALLEARRALVLADDPTTVDGAVEAARQATWIARTRRLTREWTGRAGATGRRLPSGDTGSDPLAIAFVAQLKANWAAVKRDNDGRAPTDAFSTTSAADGQDRSLTTAKLLSLGLGWDAFQAAQDIGVSAAARALLQNAARAGVKDPQLTQLIARQQALTADLQTRELALFQGAIDKDRFAALQADKATLDALDAEVRRRFPGYAELVSPGAIGLRAVQDRLKPGEGLLYIQPAWNDVYVFAVSRDAFLWHKVAITAATIDEKVRRLRCVLDGISCHLGEDGGRPFDRALAHDLYRDVVAPSEAALRGVDHLFVVASGGLGGLPLGLLTTATGDAVETPWLADRYALTVLPSVSGLHIAAPTTAGSAMQAFVGFGDPTLGPPEEASPAATVSVASRSAGARGPDGLALPDRLRALPSLPNTRRELTRIAAVLQAPPQSLHLGAAATERAVRTSAALEKAGVVVFATHGLLPRSIDGVDEPGLVFTPPARASAADDGILTASEAARLSLSAEWVVLSACNTAAAGAAGGETLSGLARAFLYAGAHSLLASHWPVSDEATAALTSETIRIARLRPELGKARALQAAMRAVRTGRTLDGGALAGWQAAWADPWFWAPFVLIETGG